MELLLNGQTNYENLPSSSFIDLIPSNRDITTVLFKEFNKENSKFYIII